MEEIADVMNALEKPLQWGTMNYKQMVDQMKEWGYRKDSVLHKSLKFGNVRIQTFYPGDCGVLLMIGANYATKEILDQIHTIATKNGFSKIFATVVGRSATGEIFKKQPLWKFVAEGMSNRSNGYSTDQVFVYYNPNCEHKGH